MQRDPGPAARCAALRERITGEVVGADDPAYEAHRQGLSWNRHVPARHPALIVHAASAEDVAAAVRFAAANGLRVAVRGGGHHFNAPALQDHALLIDLGGLRDLRVDAAARRAIASPGVTGRELMAALTPLGLAFPVGHCGSVPLSGYVLNGGFGWNSGAFGPACASVEAVDVVTADGRSRRVDAQSDAELFWAVRGAGPTLPAIVTGLHLRLHELPRAIRTSTLLCGADDLDAAGWVAEVQRDLPPAVELAALVVSPRTLVVTATAFAASAEQAAAWLAPFAAVPDGVAARDRQLDVSTTFSGLLDGMDQLFPAGQRYASDQLWSRQGPEVLLAGAADALLHPPSARDFVLMAYGPNLPVDAPAPPDMALSVPGRVYVGIYAVWDDAAADDDNRRWVAAVSAAMAPHAAGRYVGEVDLDADRQHVAGCFAPAAWQRLAALRARLDPQGRFACHGELGTNCGPAPLPK